MTLYLISRDSLCTTIIHVLVTHISAALRVYNGCCTLRNYYMCMLNYVHIFIHFVIESMRILMPSHVNRKKIDLHVHVFMRYQVPTVLGGRRI